MRHIVAGSPALYTHRLCARCALAYRLCACSRIGCAPGVLGVGRCAASLLQSPLRGSLFFGPASRAGIGCCIVDTLLQKCHARCAGSRFALRAQVVRRCATPLLALLRSLSSLAASRLASLHRAALLRCSPCPLRGRSLVRRCCGALSPLRGARSAVRRCCAARPRFAGRRPVSPLLRLAVGLRARHLRPCLESTFVPGRPHSLPILKYIPGIYISNRVSLSVPGVHVSTRPSTSVSTSRRGPYPSNITIFFTPPTPLKRGWVPIEHPLNQDLDIGGR